MEKIQTKKAKSINSDIIISKKQNENIISKIHPSENANALTAPNVNEKQKENNQNKEISNKSKNNSYSNAVIYHPISEQNENKQNKELNKQNKELNKQNKKLNKQSKNPENTNTEVLSYIYKEQAKKTQNKELNNQTTM